MTGKIVSTKMKDTLVVSVETRYSHPKYTKIVRKDKKYMVHAPEHKMKDGDVVKFVESVPVSKNKKWKLLT